MMRIRCWMGSVLDRGRVGRVIEPELDMKREALRPAPRLFGLRQLLGWITPDRRALAAPMRSLAREMEERFPSCEI